MNQPWPYTECPIPECVYHVNHLIYRFSCGFVGLVHLLTHGTIYLWNSNLVDSLQFHVNAESDSECWPDCKFFTLKSDFKSFKSSIFLAGPFHMRRLKSKKLRSKTVLLLKDFKQKLNLELKKQQQPSPLYITMASGTDRPSGTVSSFKPQKDFKKLTLKIKSTFNLKLSSRAIQTDCTCQETNKTSSETRGYKIKVLVTEVIELWSPNFMITK